VDELQPVAELSAEELQRITEMSADELVVRLDLDLARKRFRAMLVAAEAEEALEAAAAAERYQLLALSWDDDGPQTFEQAAPALPPQFSGLEVFELSGTIKWFDVQKGYGFIAPDNGLADVLLHVTCLRAGGYQTAHEGARVHCQVLRRPRGMQASGFFRWTTARPSTPP
jgi:cold shock CspA family protein